MTKTQQENPTRILVVGEDDQAPCHTLRQAGYEACHATTSAQALACLESDGSTELVVFDIAAAGAAGIAPARSLRAATASPFLFLLPAMEADVVETSIECGAAAFLLKPVSAAQLLSSVALALARGAELKRLRSAEQTLTAALESGRDTNMAIGLLMERFGFDRALAFDRLREQARQRRMKVHEVAIDLIRAVESISVFHPSHARK